MEWNDWISLGVSLLAIIGTCYTYFKHDKKIKLQESKINAYHIKQMEQAEIERKKALIRGNIIKFDKGKRILKIYNSGRSIARNIRIEGMEVQGIFVYNDSLFPYELMNPQDYTELEFSLACSHPNSVKLKYLWDDEFGDDNEFEQVLTI